MVKSFASPLLLLFFFMIPVLLLQTSQKNPVQSRIAEIQGERQESALQTETIQKSSHPQEEQNGAKNRFQNQKLLTSNIERELGSGDDPVDDQEAKDNYQMQGGYITVGSGNANEDESRDEIESIGEPKSKVIEWKGSEGALVYNPPSDSPLFDGN